MAKILVVDDERSIRSTLKELLTMENHEVEVSEDGLTALEQLTAFPADLIISDIKMPNMDGTELLAKVCERYPTIQVIMVSGHGTIDTAVECMKIGANDFIEKPIEMNRLLTSVRNTLEMGKIKIENKVLKRKILLGDNAEIIGTSEQTARLKERITKAAAVDTRVLITGPNGTGKELVAKQLYIQSARANNQFVDLNCAAVAADLIESELFGHEKGSFTSSIKQHKGKFEQANGGTLFLDEIGDMSLTMQAKLLRVLQENRISRVGSESDLALDVRIIAATNKNLVKEIAAGTFREDLYHRLNVLKIEIPSLADRSDDIKPLCEHFIKILCAELKHRPMTFGPGVFELLETMPWTGNIRELRNVVERMIILGSTPDMITTDDVKQLV